MPFDSPYLRPAPSYAGGRVNRALLPVERTTEITVDCRSGERGIETREIPAPPPPPLVLYARPRDPKADWPRCPTCDEPFQRSSPNQVYCSPSCWQSARKNRVRQERKTDRKPTPRPGRIRRIQEITAAAFGVPFYAMTDPSRVWAVAHPRQAAMSITGTLLGASLLTIGRAFGGRDHTTVMNAFRACEKRRKEDAKFDALYRLAEEQCRSALEAFA